MLMLFSQITTLQPCASILLWYTASNVVHDKNKVSTMPRIMSLSWGLLRMRQHLAPSAGGHMLIYRQLRDWHLAFLSPIKMANIYYCLAKKVPFFISTSNPSSQCLKIQKKSYSTLRAKRATFTFWLDKCSMEHFGWFSTQFYLRSFLKNLFLKRNQFWL